MTTSDISSRIDFEDRFNSTAARISELEGGVSAFSASESVTGGEGGVAMIGSGGWISRGADGAAGVVAVTDMGSTAVSMSGSVMPSSSASSISSSATLSFEEDAIPAFATIGVEDLVPGSGPGSVRFATIPDEDAMVDGIGFRTTAEQTLLQLMIPDDFSGDVMTTIDLFEQEMPDQTFQADLTISVAPDEIELLLVDAETQEVLQPLFDGAEIDLDALGASEVSILAQPSEEEGFADAADSFVFQLDAPGEADDVTQTENIVPFALFGDVPGDGFGDRDATGQTFEPGDYAISAQAFDGTDGTGLLLATEDLTFTFV
ncbi:MAG: hypothetical protein AAF913_00010 [Pseudomonadota bacterium]